MNILIPDSWLRDFLKTKATPQQIKECLSLCGPSVERIHQAGDETVYDIEITTNRVDCMSVNGIAREAAVILPQFSINATYIPPKLPSKDSIEGSHPLGIIIKNDPLLCRRICAVKLENVVLAESPIWLKARLELAGQRSLNNIIDITNYVMWELGHQCHAFDYDRLREKTLIVRKANKGEHLITLDGKKHILHGGEIIFDDGTGEIIDLPGIMGTENTVVTNQTKNVLLFIENSDPSAIRSASMELSIRSQAAIINEKGPDPESASMAIIHGALLAQKIAHATIASKFMDIYPSPRKPKVVTLLQQRLNTYINFPFPKDRVKQILSTLGCHVTVKEDADETKRTYHIIPPSWRTDDICIPEDTIEEISRIYGYHAISNKLPDGETPLVFASQELLWEEEMKIRLRDWGYTELYTYSMISEKLMEIFGLDKKKTYKIANPLSGEWVYLRPTLWPGMLTAIKDNLHLRQNLSFFELGMRYEKSKNGTPIEYPSLTVTLTGTMFRQAKGLAESIFSLFGIKDYGKGIKISSKHPQWHTDTFLSFGSFGSVSIVHPELLEKIGIHLPITILDLQFNLLVQNAHPIMSYKEIPKFPPIIEDLTFLLPKGIDVHAINDIFVHIGGKDPSGNNFIQSTCSEPFISSHDPNTEKRTFHITYQDTTKTLRGDEIRPFREKIIQTAIREFSAQFKTS